MTVPMVRLKQVAKFINGKAFKPTDWSEEGVPIIRIQNLNGLDKPFNYWAGSLDKEVRVQRNDLLLAWSGTPGTSFGAHIWRGGAAVLNQHIFRVDLNENSVTKEWAKFVINAQLSTLIGMAHGGVGLKHVTKGMVEGLEIPLPPLPEQRRIAAILDQADALRAKRRKALAQLDSLTQSIFIEMFGGANEYPISSLADLCELITDGTHQTPEYADDGVIFLSAKNVTSGYVDWERIKFIPQSLHLELHRRLSPRLNDILLAKNGTTGVAAIVDRDCTFDIYVSLALLRAKQGVLPAFLLGAINSPICKQQFNDSLKGVGVPNLHLKEIRATQIPHPPLSLQNEFLSRITALEKLKVSQRSSLAELDNLFASLQHRAFQGEL